MKSLPCAITNIPIIIVYLFYIFSIMGRWLMVFWLRLHEHHLLYMFHFEEEDEWHIVSSARDETKEHKMHVLHLKSLIQNILCCCRNSIHFRCGAFECLSTRDTKKTWNICFLYVVDSVLGFDARYFFLVVFLHLNSISVSLRLRKHAHLSRWLRWGVKTKIIF